MPRLSRHPRPSEGASFNLLMDALSQFNPQSISQWVQKTEIVEDVATAGRDALTGHTIEEEDR